MAEYSAVSFKIEADNKPALSAIGEIKTALKDLKVDFKIKVPKGTMKSLASSVTKELASETSKAMGKVSETIAGTATKSTEEAMKKAAKATESATKKAGMSEAFARQLVGQNTSGVSQLDVLEEKANRAREALVKMVMNGELNGAFNEQTMKLKQLESQIDAIRAKSEPAHFNWNAQGGYTTGLSNPITTPESVQRGNEQFSSMVDQMREQIQQTRSESEKMWDAFVRGAERGLSAAKQALSAVAQLAKTCATALKNLAVNGFDKLSSSVTKSVKGVTQLVSALGRIAMYRALRTAIKTVTESLKEGMENLYRWSRLNDGEFMTSMDKLATEALHVKNALAAALAPAVNALTPVVERLAHAFINVVNSINQFISSLAGASTWTRALHTPVTYAQMAGSSFDKANKKAKELKNTILAFDEINRLNGKTDSNTSSELPYGSMFEKVPLDNFWKKWLDKLDWTDLGRLVAQRANKLLGQLDKWILTVARPWAMKWSTRIATFLNGFVKDFDWKLLGKTIADGLMTVVYAVNNFFDLFEAKEFGKNLAKTVKGWFENMDWEAVGRYFSNGLNFIADTASGFFQEFVQDAFSYGQDLGTAFKSWVDSIHWNEIRTALTTGLESVANLIRGFVTNEDGSWDKLMKEFADTVTAVITSPSLDDILSAGTDLINSIIDVIPTMPWEDIGMKIGTVLGNIHWDEFLVNTADAFLRGFGGAIKGWLESDHAFGNTVAIASVAAIGAAFGIGGGIASGALHQVGQTLASSIGSGMFEALPGMISAFISGPGGIVMAIAGIAYDIWGVCKLAATGYELVGQQSELAAAQANAAAQAVNLQAALAAQGINVSLEEVNAHLNGTMSLAELTGGKFGAMSQEVSGEVSGMAKTTSDAFSKLSDNTFDFTKDVNGAVSKFLTEASDGSTESMKQLSDDTVKIFSEISDAVAKINTALSTSFSKMASSISDSMQRMYNSVSSNMTRIAKNVEDNARRIQNAFSSISGSNMTIKGYATGGFPEDGLFMANHNELVGGFANGKTAVANNAEITAGIEAAVYSAMTSAMSNSSGGGDIVIRIDSEEIARASIKGQRRIDRRMNPTVKFTG